MSKAIKQAPWPVLLLVLSFLCPTELSVYVAGARLPPHRALLLVLIPFALLHLVSRRGVKVQGFDVALLAFAVWMLFSFIYHHGFGDGLQTGGALALDGFGSYLIARSYVRSERDFIAVASLLFLAAAVSAAIALPEMLTSQFYVHDFLRDLTGYVHPTGVEKRLGLTRAFGTFDHPIHLGTFCAAGLALAVYASRTKVAGWIRGLIIPMCAFTGLSSAPILCIGLQAGLMGLERTTRRLKDRVMIGLGVVIALFAGVSLVATRSLFAIIATGFTIDSWTGYYRLMIWESGLNNVWANPILGIGMNDWERPIWMYSPTVDAFWLVIAMRSGLPALILLIGGLLFLARGGAKRLRRGEKEHLQLARGWLISLAALILVGCTVHYWNVLFAFFFFFIGLGAWFADPLPKRARLKASVATQAALARVTWLPPGSAGVYGTGVPAWAIEPPSWPVAVVRNDRGEKARGTAA